jgi:PhoPQ-activated pathogenicity-related protein
VIAYTWQHFLNDPSKPEWLLRFPMTKAAMRAMDAITDYCAKNFALQLDHYAVAGASKRGWTTWDVGAVDGPSGRTAVIIPVVLDAINFVHTIHHQFRSYGNWSFALKDYIQLDLMQRLEDPNMPAMQGEIDPFFYRDR